MWLCVQVELGLGVWFDLGRSYGEGLSQDQCLGGELPFELHLGVSFLVIEGDVEGCDLACGCNQDQGQGQFRIKLWFQFSYREGIGLELG